MSMTTSCDCGYDSVVLFDDWSIHVAKWSMPGRLHMQGQDPFLDQYSNFAFERLVARDRV